MFIFQSFVIFKVPCDEKESHCDWSASVLACRFVKFNASGTLALQSLNSVAPPVLVTNAGLAAINMSLPRSECLYQKPSHTICLTNSQQSRHPSLLHLSDSDKCRQLTSLSLIYVASSESILR